ncbi:protein of unknown function DUF497 [Acetobacter senegalensis]|uniref:BrnT family toxin n=1 Tax=Acetobacter senegalensis TaxID=446692 RepID=A0A0U5B755_9PROT|nr:BrnT family toxin [Acetobacter senegalensis]CEF40194.1 protein of unknown function DUF497 [Acetobacter senegalensis]
MTDGPKSFEWDDAKSDACFEERGFSFADVLMIFAGPVIERPDDRKDYGEPRIRAAGLIEGVPFMVVYTLRGDSLRIISARKMHRKEWLKWQE